MIQILNDRMSLARDKFVNAPMPRTAGVEFLRFMLLNFNLAEAASYKDDVSLYTGLVAEYQDKFRTVFDPCWTKSLSISKFTKGANNRTPTEIFLNCSVADPANELPFDGDWAAWKTSTRSLRIVYHDSCELPIDMFNGLINFKEIVPSFVMIAVNVPVLLMKWIKYSQYCKERKIEADELVFLKETEYENFFYDLTTIFVTNLILKTVLHPDASADSIVSEFSVPAFITTDSIIENGIASLQEQLKLLDSRNLKLQDLLDTDWYEDDSTIRQKINQISDDYALPELRPYKWISLFKYLPYLKMIAAIIDRDPENPLFKPLIRKAYNLYVKEIKFANLPSTAYMTPLKNYISVSCKEFEQLFKDKIDAPVAITA